MSSSEGSYYVPAQSRLPIVASLGLFLTIFGIANWINGNDKGPLILLAGGFIFAFVLWNWFATVIDENIAGKNSPQLKRSYVWGMGWFIFSEVMFFSAFFGALFYIRNVSLMWLDTSTTNEFLWPNFHAEWPLVTTPDMTAHGDKAGFVGPKETMTFPGLGPMFAWLPFWNTVVLLSSSVTVHLAHTALKNNKRNLFNGFLGLTVLLGMIFVSLQIFEYHHAYTEMGLTLKTGVYGTTFFMLTGFHGAHVTLGTFMLLVMLLRSVLKGHFKPHDCFGFEAASWYWHFVDVVWVGLFIFVYVMG